MPAPAPLLPAWLRAELAPTPGRWRNAAVVAAAATAALAVALTLQFGTFPAPLMAFKGLMPSIVWTWALLGFRLAAVAAGAVLAVWFTGVGVQLPWLLVPGFFAVIAGITYLVPIRQNPIAGYCLALLFAGVTFSGIYAPRMIGPAALTMAVGFAIGISGAALVARLRALPSARDRLAAALAEAFADTRVQLAEAGARFRAGTPVPGDAVTRSALDRHLKLLALVRMEHGDFTLERASVALITVAERAALFAAAADQASRQPSEPALRRGVDAELGALLTVCDHALARFAEAARTPEAVFTHDGRVPPDWPDFPALLAALRAREHTLVAEGVAIGRSEATTYHAFVQALDGFADVLHTPPEELEAAPAAAGAPPPPRRLLPPFDPYAAQFALKIGLASVLALLAGVTAHVRALETVVLNPLILVQGSYGATIRRAWLRLAGVVAGGILAIATVVSVMANTDDVAVWLVVFAAVLLPCAYIALGTERFGYFGTQVAATFMIVLVADRPVTDPDEALWRFYGTVLGAGILFAVFQVVAPDYAGRQLVSRFAGLVQLLLGVAPQPGAAPISPARGRVLTDQITAGIADVLRLVEEARFEGAASGVDREAALQAAGILRRVAHRLTLTRRARRIPRPPLPAVDEPRAAFDAALRARLARLLDILTRRHHRAHTGSAAHRAAIAAARAAAATPPAADLDGPLATLGSAADALRRDPPAAWTREALSALLAEVGHLQRIAALMPSLEAQLVRAVLPGDGPDPIAHADTEAARLRGSA